MPYLIRAHEGPRDRLHRHHLRPPQHREVALRRRAEEQHVSRHEAAPPPGPHSEPHAPQAHPSLVHRQRFSRRPENPHAKTSRRQNPHREAPPRRLGFRFPEPPAPVPPNPQVHRFGIPIKQTLHRIRQRRS